MEYNLSALLIANGHHYSIFDILIIVVISALASYSTGLGLIINGKSHLIIRINTTLSCMSAVYGMIISCSFKNMTFDLSLIIVPILLILWITGIGLICYSKNQLVDFNMLTIFWCSWGSAMIGVLASLKGYVIVVLTTITILIVKQFLIRIQKYSLRT